MFLNESTEIKSITEDINGANNYSKTSYPVRYGIYSEVDTSNATFHFNLNHELIRIIGKGPHWPHPQEWLKRTTGNDWVYYSTGGYTGVFETTGEYYLPNLPYPTNKSMGGEPFKNASIQTLIDNSHTLLSNASINTTSLPGQQRKLVNQILENNQHKLEARAERFLDITGGHISVLPPDTRHVDYNVVPLTISRGCLYKCSFCKVKNKKPFEQLSTCEITEQLKRFASFYRQDLKNCNSLFLGEHDALQASPELICFSITEGYQQLEFSNSYFNSCCCFFFGSITSLLNAPDHLFDELERLPLQIYINIGFESADQKTLDQLGKPVLVKEVLEAFTRMKELNDTYRTIEITGNFLVDNSLPQSHIDSLASILGTHLSRPRVKGSIYLSPMQFNKPSRSKLFEFYRYKLLSKLPLFLYTIQRL